MADAMSGYEITDDLIEACAKELRFQMDRLDPCDDWDKPWESLDEFDREYYRTLAEAVLATASKFWPSSRAS